MFKDREEGRLFDIAEVLEINDKYFECIKYLGVPALDTMNTDHNFVLRSDIYTSQGRLEEHICVDDGVYGVQANMGGVKKRGSSNSHYDNNGLIREIIYRMKPETTVFFEEDHTTKSVAKFVIDNAEFTPSIFVSPFGGFIVVYDDPFRENDIVVRFFNCKY